MIYYEAYNLDIVSIENNVVATLDLDAVIEKFADMKARKNVFYKFCFLYMINESYKMKWNNKCLV